MVRPFICYRSRAGRFMKRPYMPPVFYGCKPVSPASLR